MKRPVLHRSCALALATAALLVVQTAAADANTEASDMPTWFQGVSKDRRDSALRIYRTGNRFLDKKEYAKALDRYRKALSEWDHPAIRYNAAVCLIAMERHVEALSHMKSALRENGSGLKEHVRRQGRSSLQLLTRLVATVTVSTDQEGVEIMLDGTRLLVGPGSATRTIRPGGHQLVAKRAGFVTFSESLDTRAGQTTSRSIHLDKPEVKIVRAGVVTRRRWAKWKPWTVAGAGLFVTAAAVPLHLAYRSKYDEFGDELRMCPPREGCNYDDLSDEAKDLESRAKLYRRLTIAGYVAGGALVAGGITMLVLNREQLSTATRITAAPVDGGAIAVFEGRF